MTGFWWSRAEVRRGKKGSAWRRIGRLGNALEATEIRSFSPNLKRQPILTVEHRSTSSHPNETQPEISVRYFLIL